MSNYRIVNVMHDGPNGSHTPEECSGEGPWPCGSLSDENAPSFEVVADHRFDRLEQKYGREAWPGGPPTVTYRVHCKCGAHSPFLSAANLAHAWHEHHREHPPTA